MTPLTGSVCYDCQRSSTGRGWRHSNEQPIPHDQLVKVLTDQCHRHVKTITELRERLSLLEGLLKSWAEEVETQSGRDTMARQSYSPVRFMVKVREQARAAIQPTPTTTPPEG